MEDDAALEADIPPAVVAGQTARLDLAQGAADLDSALAVTRDAAIADLADAESALTSATATIGGIASELLDSAIPAVQKRISKAQGDAATALTQAYQQLFSVGAAPVIAAPDVVKDISRGDYLTSAIEQLIQPLSPSDVDCAKSPNADVCAVSVAPPAIEFDPFAPATTPGPAPAEPLPAEPVVAEPIAPTTPEPYPYVPPFGEPAACPAPVIDVPACPVPAVILVDRESGTMTSVPGAYSPGSEYPTPVITPFQTPTTPTAPPTPTATPPAVPKFGNYAPTQQTLGVPLKPVPTPNWNRPDRCAVMGNRLGAPAGVTSATLFESFREEFRRAKLEDDRETDELRTALAAQGRTLDRPVTRRWDSVTDKMNTYLMYLAGSMPDEDKPNESTVAGIMALRALDAKVGGPWDYLSQGLMYDLQYQSPQYLPSQSEVDACLLNGTITRELWACLTRANGNHIWSSERVLAAKRARPAFSDYISLFRRGLITRGQLDEYGSQNGYMNTSEIDEAIKASEFIPPYSDIVRMMVRDSADEQAVAFGGFDSGFREKFAGPLKEWAQANGITEDVFKYLWRAHWELPSPTQLYEMLRRLRPGRVDDKIAVTPDVVKQVLTQNDLAPGFVDRLMAVSYNTITRTDLLAWYVNGAVDEPELIERLQDNGYSLDDAKRIVEGWRVEKANRVQNRALLWTRRNITKHYVEGNVDRDSAAKLLSRSIPNKKDVDDVLDDADMVRKAERRRKCIRAVRRRMFTGEITEIETRRELVRLGLDASVAADLAEGWTCEIASAAKEPTVKMLTGWLQAGVIDTNDFYQRLLNLRYSREDAKRILDTALVVEAKRLQALAEKAAKEAEARREKAAKEAQRQREKQAKAAQQQQRGRPKDQSP